MQVGRKVVFVIAANVAGAVLGYGALLVIGRYFAPAAYGSFVFALGMAGLFALATTLGLGSAHQRLVARGVPEAVVVGTAGRLRLALLSGGLVLALALAWLIPRLGGPTLTDATTPIVLGGALALQVVAMARQFLADTWAGRQHVTRIEGGRVLDAFLLLVFLANAGLMIAHLADRWTPLPAVGAWWADRFALQASLSASEAALLLVGCSLAAKVLSLLVSAAWAIRDGIAVGGYDATVARDLWAFALPVAITGAITLVVQFTDVVVLGFFWTAQEVGLYGTAQKLATMAALTATAALGVLLSRFAQLSAAGDAVVEGRTFRDAQRWVLLIVAPAVAALVALAVPIIHIAVGDAYLAGAPALRLLALSMVGYALQVPLTARFMGHGRTRVLVVAGLVNAGANVVLNLLFIPKALLGWGPAGAALATLASNLLAYLVLLGRGRREFGLRWIEADAVRILLAAAVAGTLAWQAVSQWPTAVDRVWELVGWGVAGLLVYAGVLALLGGVRRSDMAVVHRAAHPVALWHELRGR